MNAFGRPYDRWATVLAVGCVSAVVVALQVVLIRALSVVSYHHFIYLVISTALLGFGASGTLLSLLRERIAGGFGRWSFGSLALFTASSAWIYRIAVAVPLDMQYLLHSPREWLLLAVVVVVAAVPFFAGGFFIGLVIMTHAKSVARLYSVNMVASGVGGVLAVSLLAIVSADRAFGWLGLLAAVALLVWFPAGVRDTRRIPRRARLAKVSPRLAIVVAALVLAIYGVVVPPELRIDQYKAESHAIRLAEQGDAELIAETAGPRSRITVYKSQSMHFTLFASPLAPPPPPQLQLFADGNLAGAVFQITDPEQAPVLRTLPQSIVYRLSDHPDVLLLGEASGINVWLALAHGARSVTVVQEDPSLVGVIRDDLAGLGGEVYSRSDVKVVPMSPRLFLERGSDRFDVIQLANAEAMPAAGGGLASLREDYLLTVEGVAAALERLNPGGLLSVTRGLQSPPRDNIRLFALFAETVRNSGVEAADRLLQARNYLAATTIVSSAPLGDSAIAEFRDVSAELLMDADYFPGIRAVDLTARNSLLTDTGDGSYYYQAASAIVGADAEFLADWVFDLSPPSDDQPYFHNFFRLRHISDHIAAYGDQWFSRLELGSAVVAVTLLILTVLGLILILLPVIVLARVGSGNPGRHATPSLRRAHTVWTVAHFGLIGLGFMFLEMVFIQRLTRYLGDPLIATTAVLCAVLTFAGLGSAVQGRVGLPAALRMTVGAGVVVLLALVYRPMAELMMDLVLAGTTALRFGVAVAALAPISFALGWQFPAGMSVLEGSQALLPVAWATNGVASVVAAPLAVVVALSFGFRIVTMAAVCCYALVALLACSQLLPRKKPD